VAGVLRGEIYWANLDPTVGREQRGTRPVLVLSHDLFNDRSQTPIVAAITSQPQRAGYPLTYRLPAGTLPSESWIKVSQVRTIAVQRLGNRIGRIGDDDLKRIVDGLNQLIA
jgi:mRNA interferase MazF